MVRGEIVLDPAESSATVASKALLSLVFEKHRRPDADAIAELAGHRDEVMAFSISHRPPGEEGWLELLVRGMTFDCHGLVPADAIDLPDGGSLLGLADYPHGAAIAILPGPHLEPGRAMMPVIRNLAGLGQILSRLPGLLAVRWLPAKSWMTPDYYNRLVKDWLLGGAFPALGLTALERQEDGSMVSRGLEFLIGQELRLDPKPGMSAMQMARIAVRMVHMLIDQGRMEAPATLTGPDGEILIATPVRNRTRLHIAMQS